jgi:ribosomal protein S18 acetylase RimI-like enzyme
MDDLAELIENNVAEFLLGMGGAGGGERRATDEVTWTVGGSPIGYHNAVVRCAAATHARAREIVDQWRTELRDRALPGSWHLTPAMRPAALAELLTAAGFQDGGDEPAMAADLTKLGGYPAADGLAIEVVETEGDLVAYRDVLAAGFGEGPKEADWVTATFATIGLKGGPWHHLLGRLGADAVGTASLLMTARAGGIYFVCTRPDMRRRGYGAAVTRQAMVEAARLGASHAVLGSSPMGQRVYEKLGFRTVFSYRLFEFEP